MIFAACSKHEILYNSTNISSDVAEFQLFNFIPAAASSETLFKSVVLNGKDTIATENYPISRYNGIPLGSTTRFFVRTPGDYTIQCFKKAGSTTPDYEGTFTLTAGKQIVYLHSWSADPVVLDAGYPYGQGTRVLSGAASDSLVFINFVNMWYSSSGVACTDELQYQYALCPSTKSASSLNFSSYSDTQWTNVGGTVKFGEQTGFQPIVIPNRGYGYLGGPDPNTTTVTSGYANIYTRTLDVTTQTVLPYYIDYWTGIGVSRYINHIVRGTGRQNYMCTALYAL